jgi:hypothetical protein
MALKLYMDQEEVDRVAALPLADQQLPNLLVFLG